jgi:Domain of unknown function (DUF5615)
MALPFYMDVHVPSAVTEGLRRRGLDVTSQDDGTRSVDDESLLERASGLRRILVTQDEDLLVIGARWQAVGREFSGIVFARQIGTSLGQLIDDLQLIAECCDALELASRVIYAPFP